MNITLGISSGIAAFKTLELIKLLKSDGHTVQVIMTRSAAHMMNPEEFQRATGKKVYTELFEEDFDYKDILKKRSVDHIEVAKNTDLFVVAPATANTIAKLAQGITDDFLTTTLLATDSQVLVCPSMNTQMWYHPAFQQNLKLIKEYGYIVMEPNAGELACGTEGIGRLPEPSEIFEEIQNILAYKNSLRGKKIIITAGGTIEPIDSARVLTNKSSGKMGIALANECYRRGAEVLLLKSKTAIHDDMPIKKELFDTSVSLESLLQKHIQNYDYIFHAAAVSDFTIKQFAGKIDSNDEIDITLKPTPKIISEIKKWKPTIKLVGFKAVHGIDEETMKKVKEKLKTYQADAMIINDISREDIGFGSDENEVIIMTPEKEYTIKKTSKKEVAKEIVTYILAV